MAGQWMPVVHSCGSNSRVAQLTSDCGPLSKRPAVLLVHAGAIGSFDALDRRILQKRYICKLLQAQIFLLDALTSTHNLSAKAASATPDPRLMGN
jgi:hypothetical protein